MRSRGVGCRAVTPGWPGQSALPSLPHLTGHHPTGLISETFIINTSTLDQSSRDLLKTGQNLILEILHHTTSLHAVMS